MSDEDLLRALMDAHVGYWGAVSGLDYDALAEQFYAETTQMAPGKDDPFPPTISDAERRKLWADFIDKRRVALYEAFAAAEKRLNDA